MFKTLIYPVLMSLCFLACEQSEEVQSLSESSYGEVSFSFDDMDVSASNTRTASLDPDQIVVTIQSAEGGELVYDKEALDVISFNGNYISDPIALEVGSYELVEYLVLDENGEVLYLTPLEGSELAYLVDTPLAMSFDIATDDSKQITPEVISPEGYDASDFGYTDFDFEVVNTIDFLMSVHYFDKISESYELTDASVKVYAGDTLLYENDLLNETTQIRVRDEFGTYTIVTSKSGYEQDTVVLDNSSLKFYQDEPLIVILKEIEVEYFDVYAMENSVTGGVGLSVGTFYPGDKITITCAEDDFWYWIVSSSFTNANGASGDLWSIFGFQFRLLSLVGSFDGGITYFKVGTNFETIVDSDEPVELTLYAWDVDFANNSGFVTASVTRQ
ncbi:hypothetical protein [Reichenbachiella versicolor]|uniref:hypothetical protein n=1 Tax=Reichenbachiella versicolor TaxID=1821036 RepID=UPI0013A57C14|nr:hypothetical protein [Reichenbachiella versicolor]